MLGCGFGVGLGGFWTCVVGLGCGMVCCVGWVFGLGVCVERFGLVCWWCWAGGLGWVWALGVLMALDRVLCWCVVNLCLRVGFGFCCCVCCGRWLFGACDLVTL